MRHKAATLAAVFCALGLQARGAHASGRQLVGATAIFTQTFTIPANTDYNLHVLPESLTPYEDPVMYVITDSSTPTMIGFNDDCPGYGQSSCLNIPRVGYVRYARVIVRAKAPYLAGSGTLRMGGCSATPCTYWDYSFSYIDIPKFAGVAVNTGELLWYGAKVMTARHFPKNGAKDTVLFVEYPGSNGPTVVGFDDDSGLKSTPETSLYGMSHETLYTNCYYPCTAWVGTYYYQGEGDTWLLWDTLAYYGPDSDFDGFSDSLENAIGTSPTLLDTDGDGLWDGHEFYGLYNLGENLQFAYWGANPRHKDIFLEADFRSGFNLTHELLRNTIDPFNTGDPTNKAGNPDGYGGVKVHVDTGTIESAFPTEYGNWGGAGLVGSSVGGCNATAHSPGRKWFFHHTVMTGNAAGSGNTPGPCFTSILFSGSAGPVHELGHNVHLNHSGKVDAVANCKANYGSVMNYAGATSDKFSAGSNLDVDLNPFSLPETTGMAGRNVQWLWSTHGFKVSGTMVDWNRDGRFDAGARGAPNLVGGDCEIGMPHRTVWGSVSAAWLGVLSTANYVFVVASGGTLKFAQGGSVASCATEGLARWGEPCPSSFSALTAVPGAVAVSGPGSAAAFMNGATPTLLTTYREAASPGRFFFQTATGPSSWGTPTEVDPVLRTVPAGAIAGVTELDNQIRLYVPVSDATVREYVFNPGTNSFSFVGVLNAGGLTITGNFLPAAGFEKGQPRRLYAAFLKSGESGQIRVARREASGSWTELTGLWPSPDDAYKAGFTPAISYVPFSPTVPDEGRLQVTYKIFEWGGTAAVLTEGNDTSPSATSRRLRFVRRDDNQVVLGTQVLNASSWAPQHPSVVSSSQAHSAVVMNSTEAWFLPFVDGVFNAPFTDHEDFPTIGRNVQCSIRCRDGFTDTDRSPNASYADGCCPKPTTGSPFWGWDRDCDEALLRNGDGIWDNTVSCRP